MLYQPRRTLVQLAPNRWELTVTPPSDLKIPPGKLVLTTDQKERFLLWLEQRESLAKVFPEFSLNQREIILSGIDDQWDDLIPD